jgi:hypothetical protein
MNQLLLFPLAKAEELRLQVAAVTAAQHRRAKVKEAHGEWVRRILLQFAIWGEPTPITCRVRAERRKAGPAPKTRPVVADVFSFAAMGQRIAVGKGGERSILRIVTREDGVTRHQAIREQETPEWAEREQARRARQRPPRPPRAAKTRSRKFRNLIGEDDA